MNSENLILSLIATAFVVFFYFLGLFRGRPADVHWKPLLFYAAAVGLAVGSLMLAPDPFLNWFFD